MFNFGNYLLKCRLACSGEGTSQEASSYRLSSSSSSASLSQGDKATALVSNTSVAHGDEVPGIKVHFEVPEEEVCMFN